MMRLRHILPVAGTATLLAAGPALPDPALQAWSANCLSPYMTAARAEARLPQTHDFYDLNPFSSAAPSTAQTDVTPGTDRRCEVWTPGDLGAAAATVAAGALEREGIRNDVPVPQTHADAALPGTTLLAARALNPRRIAVVHTGTRPGPDGIETFLSVERLTPEASAEALK